MRITLWLTLLVLLARFGIELPPPHPKKCPSAGPKSLVVYMCK